jgi:pimeloyl-ACP methyl ester carboxylesterase
MRVLVRPADRRASLVLPDGRRLAWSEWGPADGAPVVFCTGAGMSGALGFGADSLAPLGLRLIAPDRPGLGASDPDPSKTLTRVAADIAALLGGARARVVPSRWHSPQPATRLLSPWSRSRTSSRIPRCARC